MTLIIYIHIILFKYIAIYYINIYIMPNNKGGKNYKKENEIRNLKNLI